MARSGKIARLPDEIRDQLNERLLDGQAGSQILPWLNGLTEVKDRMVELFGGAEVNDANLSNWRSGGYQDWLDQKRESDEVKDLSSYLVKIAEDGKDIFAGASSVAAGKLYKIISQFDVETVKVLLAEKPGSLNAFLSSLANLQSTDLAKERLEHDRKKLEQAERQHELDIKKFETLAVGKFMEFAKSPEAQAIINQGGSKAVQMDLLKKLMFGDAPEPAPDTTGKEGAQ